MHQVFHGAESDIVWLQQDLGLYVVNLFDTYHASVLLGGRFIHVSASLSLVGRGTFLFTLLDIQCHRDLLLSS